jgi:hypothetical protein
MAYCLRLVSYCEQQIDMHDKELEVWRASRLMLTTTPRPSMTAAIHPI